MMDNARHCYWWFRMGGVRWLPFSPSKSETWDCVVCVGRLKQYDDRCELRQALLGEILGASRYYSCCEMDIGTLHDIYRVKILYVRMRLSIPSHRDYKSPHSARWTSYLRRLVCLFFFVTNKDPCHWITYAASWRAHSQYATHPVCLVWTLEITLGQTCLLLHLSGWRVRVLMVRQAKSTVKPVSVKSGLFTTWWLQSLSYSIE